MSELIDAHMRWVRAAGMSPRTVTERDRVLRTADFELPFGIEQASAEDLAVWFDRARWSVATRSVYFHHIHAFYLWATAGHDPVLDYDPTSGLRRPRAPRGVPRPVSPEVLADVLNRAVNPWRLFVLLAAFAGLRCKEIAGLHREDITEKRIYIREAKGGDPESVPNHPVIWGEVESFPRGPLAVHVGGRANAQWVSINTALYLRRKMGLPGVALHAFRHTYATELRKKGHDLFVVRKLMRHRSIASTQIYADVADEECEIAVATLPVPGSAST